MADQQREPMFGMDEEEELFWIETGVKVAVSTVIHPLMTVKTLMQLGHEPFPLSSGKTLIVAGRNAYFLPNALSYASQLVRCHPSGWSALFTGFGSACVTMIVGRYVTRQVTKYVDKHYSAIGGKPEFEGKDERELKDYDSFNRMLRAAIRNSAVRAVAVFAARPFTVVCIRQIAQLIGGEMKYSNCLQGLRLIGIEEGPAGLFSGVIPQLMAELTMIWGVHGLIYAAERGLTRAGIDQPNEMDERKKANAEKDFLEARRLVHFFVPHIVSPFTYPLSVVATVMATVGSGLIVSFLPYNPTLNNWQDYYEYLYPHGLRRGANLFLRVQTGAVSVGSDKQLYASTNHFA